MRYDPWRDFVGPAPISVGVGHYRPFATIVSGNPRVPDYTLTAEDVAWSAKMAAFEGDPAEVLWAMTQRYVYTYPGQKWPSFTAFIRAYAQPIAPKWSRSGSKCRPGGPYHSTPRCAPALLDRRDHARTVTFADLLVEKPEAVEITLQWAKALLPNPVPTATDFAQPDVSRAWLKRHPGSKIIKQAGMNWFMATKHSKNWPDNHVAMRGDSTYASAEPVSLLYQAFAIFARYTIRPTVWRM